MAFPLQDQLTGRFGRAGASVNKLPIRIWISYAFDYAIIIFLFILFQALDAVEPFHQHFSLQNYTLQYPFAEHERVSIGAALMISIISPIIIIAIYTLVIDGIFSHTTGRDGGRNKYTLKDRLWELNCGVLGLLLSQGAAFVITGALKNAAGKPRPDLIARCIPKGGSADHAVFGLSNSTICTQSNNAILKDGFRSFPSGHSSSSFAGLFYITLYLTAKLHVLDSRGEVWKTFLILIPTLGAALIAVSRIMDARHHPFDVISGSLLGILVAWGAYRQYFPPVSETWRKGRAYPMRTWGGAPRKPGTEEFQDSTTSIRDHSPVELLRVGGQPDAENSQPQAQGPRNLDDGREGAYRNGARWHSPASSHFDHTQPAAQENRF